MPIRLQVLGGLHAFRDDVPLAWVPAQHVSSALLVYLALERDVTREQLARVFWPDEELDAARHALRQALYRLRHAGGDGLIEDTGDVLSLSGPVACDALDFERAVEAGDFAAATALYGGTFLKDVSLSESRDFEAWVDRQRARFGRLYRRACRARIETLLGGGEVHLAMDAARAWVTVEPFDDEAQHRLIELLAGSGQRSDALAHYERYERLLEAEELEPLDETKALVAVLRAGEVGVSALAPALAPPAGLVGPVVPGPQVPGSTSRGEITPARKRQRWRGARWSQLAAAGGVVLVSAGIAGVWALRSQPVMSLYPPAREPVLVLPFEVRVSMPGYEGLGVQTADRIRAALEGNNVRVVALSAEELHASYSQRALRRLVAKKGARTVVTGVIARQADMLEAQAWVMRGSDLGTVWTLGPERNETGEPTPILDAVGERVLGAVAWYLSPWAGMDVTHPETRQPATTLEAVRLMDKASELSTGPRMQMQESIRLQREAFARDTMWLGGALASSLYESLGRWRERDSVLAFLEARRGRLYPGDALELDYRQAVLRSPEEEMRASRAWFAIEPRSDIQVMSSALRARRPLVALQFYPRYHGRLSPADSADLWRRSWQYTDMIFAQAHHMLGQFEAELRVVRAARSREPRYFGHWEREVCALAALGRTGEIAHLIAESHGLETQGAPVRLMYAAALELSLHGHTQAAIAYAGRTAAGLTQWPDSLSSIAAIAGGSSAAMTTGELQFNALRILGRHAEIVRISDELARASAPTGLGWRLLGMRSRVLLRDTAGALAIVDSARRQPLENFGRMRWARKGAPMYYGAQVLSLLGRKDEAVALLREALNNGHRLGADEPLQWYWEPIEDYPPFQELVRIR